MTEIFAEVANVFAGKIYINSNDCFDRMKIAYAIHSLLINLFETIILFSIAVFSGVLKISLILFVLACPFRYYSAGRHCKTLIGCLCMTSIILIGIPRLSLHITLSSSNIYIIFLFVLCLVATYFWAPLGTKEHPVVNNEGKRKWASVKAILFYYVLSCFINSPYRESVILMSYSLVITIIPYSGKENQEFLNAE